ncbi:hypothetical protein ABIF61_005246 [Bradyrhizobium japonicum]
MRVPDALQRETLLRRAGTQLRGKRGPRLCSASLKERRAASGAQCISHQ